jgi:hypothetical protein
MSQTRREIIAQLDAEAKARADQDAAHAAEVKTLTEKLASETARADAAVAALPAAHAELAEAIKAHSEALAALQATLKGVNAALAGEVAKHAETAKALAIAKEALADPCRLDAALKACGLDTQSAADAEADRVEVPAAPEPTVLEQFTAIKDPSAKSAFYAANKDAIKAEIKKQEVV